MNLLPEEQGACAPHQAPQPFEAAPGRWAPKMSRFENKKSLLSGHLKHWVTESSLLKDLFTDSFTPGSSTKLLFSSYVMSNSFAILWTAGCQTPLSVGFPGKNTGVGWHFLLQGIFTTQGSNLCLLQWEANSLPLNYLGTTWEAHPGSITKLAKLKASAIGTGVFRFSPGIEVLAGTVFVLLLLFASTGMGEHHFCTPSTLEAQLGITHPHFSLRTPLNPKLKLAGACSPHTPCPLNACLWWFGCLCFWDRNSHWDSS